MKRFVQLQPIITTIITTNFLVLKVFHKMMFWHRDLLEVSVAAAGISAK